jgi:5-methylcytosine-specific restriction endonuclease McrA
MGRTLKAPWNEHLSDFTTNHLIGREGMKSAALRAEQAEGPNGEFLVRRGLLDPERVEREREVVKRIRTKERKRGAKSKGLTPGIRQQVYDRDGHRCVICGSPRDLTLDHWIPRAKGGAHSVANCQTMCRSCNHAKGDMMPSEFLMMDGAPGRREHRMTLLPLARLALESRGIASGLPSG